MKPVSANFLRHAFQPDDTIAVALINKQTGEALQRIALLSDIASDRWQKWLRFKNGQRFEVYYTVNTLIPGARRRDKQDVHTIRHLFLDFDENGSAAVDNLRRRTDIPIPNYIVNTSPGKFQVIWRAADFTVSTSERLLQTLARDTGADIAVTDAPRLLRLPGFFNHKYQLPHFVTVSYFHESASSAADFPPIPADDHTATTLNPFAVPRPSQPNSRGDGSRSGEDWRRSLSRLRLGADPELLIRELAAARSDKAKPLDYARRTIHRALALIRSTPIQHRRALQ